VIKSIAKEYWPKKSVPKTVTMKNLSRFDARVVTNPLIINGKPKWKRGFNAKKREK
jgi:hypothetical protein